MNAIGIKSHLVDARPTPIRTHASTYPRPHHFGLLLGTTIATAYAVTSLWTTNVHVVNMHAEKDHHNIEAEARRAD